MIGSRCDPKLGSSSAGDRARFRIQQDRLDHRFQIAADTLPLLANTCSDTTNVSRARITRDQTLN